MSARAALEELDIAAVLAAFREQSDKHGHTAESDAELPLAYFHNHLVQRAQCLDVILPGDRQQLEIGYRRAAALAALAIATMRRIRLEQAPSGEAPAAPCSHPNIYREPASRENPLGVYRCGDCGESSSRLPL